MKDGKYEVGDWVKSSRSMVDITAGKAYRVAQSEEAGFYVVDDMNDRNWSSYHEGHWSLCSPGPTYKVGDWVKVIDSSTTWGAKKLLAVGHIAKIKRAAWSGGGWVLEGDHAFNYSEKQLEPAEPPAAWVPKVGDQVRATRASMRVDMTGQVGVVAVIDLSDDSACVLFGEEDLWQKFSALELVDKHTHRFKVGDRVSFKEWTDDEWAGGGSNRLTGTVTSVDKNGAPNVCARDDGDGWGDGGRLWAVGQGHDLQMIAATPEPTPASISASTAGHTELRLTLSLDMSEFADKLQRVVDAIRAAA